MTDDRQRIQALFWEVVSHPDPADRVRILDRECPADGPLRRRVEALVRAHGERGGFLRTPLVGPGSWEGVAILLAAWEVLRRSDPADPAAGLPPGGHPC